MKCDSVKELRDDARRLLAELEAGVRFVITKHGTPVAVLGPLGQERYPGRLAGPGIEAWEEIEAALRLSDPVFATVDEAIDQSRKRPIMQVMLDGEM